MNSFLRIWLPHELVDIINGYVLQYDYQEHKDKMYYPLKEIKGDIEVIFENSYNGMGIIFGGARNVNLGEKYGYGIYIKRLKDDSINKHLKDEVNNMQIVSIEGEDMLYSTFHELKDVLRHLKGLHTEWISMTLKYNHTLIQHYSNIMNYDII